MENLIYILPVFGLIGLAYMLYLYVWVKKQDEGEDRMKKLAGYIADGALAFLKAEYRILAIFVVIAGGLLYWVSTMVESTHWFIVVAFVIGAVFSAVAGNIGMRIATAANVRTTQAARTSLSKALQVAFKGGTVMGLGVAGLAVFGLGVLFAGLVLALSSEDQSFNMNMTLVLETLAGIFFRC